MKTKILKIYKKVKNHFLRSTRKYFKRRYLWPAIKAISVTMFFAVIAAEYFETRVQPPAPSAQENYDNKIGQMLMVGFRGTQAAEDSYIAKAIGELNLGGVILFDFDVPSKSVPRNITDPEQTKKLVADLKVFSRNEPLLVAVDAEGGKVNRLNPSMGFADIPSAKNLGKSGSGSALESYWTLARQLSDLGFNVNFGPVVDVNINPRNPVIGGIERSYSAIAGNIAPLARAFVAAHRSFGIITSLKHFPGHGSSDGDSHLGLADVTDTYEKEELLPYEQLLKNGAVDSVMTAHIIDRDVDPDYPATLSPLFIQSILRQDLGFDGVVFSDDMQMGAIVDNYGFEDAVIRAVNAGCDILVFSNNGREYDETVPYRARDIISKAVTDGRISKDRINQAYARIMELKNKL